MLNHPRLMILIGFVLVVLGAVFPLLMVLGFLTATFFLCFLSYASTISGMIFGIIGSVIYVLPESKKPHPYGPITFDEDQRDRRLII